MGCTALFFASDTMAIEAMLAFANHGKKAPDDISIAGFDDSRLARRIKPRLTTVRQDFALKGRRSVEELILLIQNSEYSSNVLLPVTLVKGESVKKIR